MQWAVLGGYITNTKGYKGQKSVLLQMVCCLFRPTKGNKPYNTVCWLQIGLKWQPLVLKNEANAEGR